MPVNINEVGTGDVNGPGSSTDNALTRFDGVTGKLIQDSTALLNDNGDLQINPTVNSGTAIQVTDATSQEIVFVSTIRPDLATSVHDASTMQILPNNNQKFPGSSKQISLLRIRGKLGDIGAGGGTQVSRFRGIDVLLTFFDDVIQTGLDGNQIRAQNNSIAWNSTGTCADMVGTQNFIACGGGAGVTTGVVALAIGNRTKVGYNSSDGGTITDGIGVRFETPKNTDATHFVTNSYGGYFQDQGDGGVGVTNSWGIFMENQSDYAIQTGTGTVEFGDMVDTKAGRKVNITEVSTATYAVLVTDYHISVQYTDTNTQITTLPAISADNHGQIYHIKDADYNANTNNITLTPTGGDTIDEDATQAITGDGDCVTVVANNTTKNWEVQ